MKNKIVKVDVSDLFPNQEPYCHKYAILRDKTADEVMAFARAHPMVFVFPIGTKSPEEEPDYTALVDAAWAHGLGLDSDYQGDPALDHVVHPIYLGDCDNIETAIQQLIRKCFGDDYATAELIETPRSDSP